MLICVFFSAEIGGPRYNLPLLEPCQACVAGGLTAWISSARLAFLAAPCRQHTIKSVKIKTAVRHKPETLTTV